MKLRALLSITALGGIATAEQIVLNAGLKDLDSPYTTFPHPIKRVAVIGAGPSGLQVAAELKDHNFNVTIFDRAPGPGGNWRFTDDIPVRESYPDAPLNLAPETPGSFPHVEIYTDGQDGRTVDERYREHWVPRPVWKNLHTNSPISITDLPGVPYPAGSPWSPSQDTVTKHVRGYAAIHGLASDDDPSVVSYLTRVEHLEKSTSNNKWTLTLKRVRKLEETNRLEVTWWKEDFDAVVVGLGLDAELPHVPEIKGIVEWSKVKDEKSATGYGIYHSRGYRRPEHYANKTVLIVGASVSGSEIARDIAPHVKKLYISRKDYIWEKLHPFQRRSFKRLPESAFFLPEIASFEPLEEGVKGIQSGKITFINGSSLEGVDEVILATGYARVNRILAQVSQDTREEQRLRPKRNTHWTGHYIPDPTLAFTNTRPWTTLRYQALGIAKIWEGTARLPNEAELWRQYNETRWNYFWSFWGTERSEALIRQWVTYLNNESLELGGRLVDTFPYERREEFAYYMTLDVQEPYIWLENFTRFEDVPASEWGKKEGKSVKLVDEKEDELDYAFTEYGLW
ncbi:FAD/NAD-P-binding domain-containing protein [Peniophora sp. CONT]|nr:FAD/NAD-P-binding domain-containing protein [Peniophora sp. CONT]